MKTAGRENPNHGATLPHNRAHGAVGQNRFRSIRGAAKQEKFQPKEVCFFLTSPFIELIGLAPLQLMPRSVAYKLSEPSEGSESPQFRTSNTYLEGPTRSIKCCEKMSVDCC